MVDSLHRIGRNRDRALLIILDLEDVRGSITQETGSRELRDIPSIYAAYTAGIFEEKKTSGVVVPCLCDEAEYVFVHVRRLHCVQTRMLCKTSV
jgi:hypothetical protein